jgi:hypothetical protein
VTAKGKGEFIHYGLPLAVHIKIVHARDCGMKRKNAMFSRIIKPCIVFCRDLQQRGLRIENHLGETILDKVKEMIMLPTTASKPIGDCIELPPEVDSQLFDFLQCILDTY